MFDKLPDNARLIAAAPEMYVLLERASGYMGVLAKKTDYGFLANIAKDMSALLSRIDGSSIEWGGRLTKFNRIDREGRKMKPNMGRVQVIEALTKAPSKSVKKLLIDCRKFVSERQWKAMYSRFVLKYTFQKAGEVMHCTAGNVDKLIATGIKNLAWKCLDMKGLFLKYSIACGEDDEEKTE